MNPREASELFMSADLDVFLSRLGESLEELIGDRAEIEYPHPGVGESMSKLSEGFFKDAKWLLEATAPPIPRHARPQPTMYLSDIEDIDDPELAARLMRWY